MINNVIFTGNLVNDMQSNTKDGKIYAYNKIGVYNGKTRNGDPRQSMFFDFVVFGRDAELLIEMAHKGDQITVMGRLEEDTSEKDGRTYVNKRVVCSNVTLNQKRPKTEAQQATTTQDPFANL